MNKIILILLYIPLLSYTQTWKYSEEFDPFDGKTILVTAKGYGGEFPYETPSFVIRYKVSSKEMDVYITGLGYTGCDNNLLKISYDNNPANVRRYSTSESIGNNALFISEYHFKQLFNDLKEHTIISVEFRNRCTINTFSFRLNGSLKSINKLLNQTVDYNPNYIKILAEKQQKINQERALEEVKKIGKVEKLIKTLKDSMIVRNIPPNSIKKYESILADKLGLYSLKNLNGIVDIEIRLHYDSFLKGLGKYIAYIKFKDGTRSMLGTKNMHFNKLSDELIFEKREKDFVNDLKYLKLKEAEYESIKLSLDAEARNIFGEKVYDSIMVNKPNNEEEKHYFEFQGLVKLNFVNSKNISEKSIIDGNYSLEFDSPVFNKINNELKVLETYLTPIVSKFERIKLLQLSNDLYSLGVSVNNIQSFDLLKRKGDVDKVYFKNGIRQLTVITKNEKNIKLKIFVDTVNEKLISKNLIL